MSDKNKEENAFSFLEEENALNEWHDMPEFRNDPTEIYTEIKLKFKTKEDLEEFSKLIGQDLTYKTISTWFPKRDKFKALD